jgi:hypothetical protein
MKSKMTFARIAAIFSTRTILFAVLLLLTPRLVFAATALVIDTATVNCTANEVVVNGSGFKPASTAPTVQLGGTTLIVITSTNTQIVADMPVDLAKAGTFSLNVTNSQGSSGSFDVSSCVILPPSASWLGVSVEAYGQGYSLPFLDTPGGSLPPVLSITSCPQICQILAPLPALYTIALPQPGAYTIGGQQAFYNGDPLIAGAAYCSIRPSTGVDQPFHNFFKTGVLAPGQYTTIPISAYYVANTAPMSVSLVCIAIVDGHPTPGSDGFIAEEGVFTVAEAPTAIVTPPLGSFTPVPPIGPITVKLPTP